MQSNSINDDFRKLMLTVADGAQAELYLYGAQVTSWHPIDGEQRYS
jgi:hypothetical protein